jgi:hypothetical protein
MSCRPTYRGVQYNSLEDIKKVISQERRLNTTSPAQVEEPKATFNGFDTYEEAVKNTPLNDKIKIDIAGINVAEIDNRGDINDLVRQGILSSEKELTPSGEEVFITAGKTLNKKLVNAQIASETVKGRITSNGNISIKKELPKTKVSQDFEKNKKSFGEQVAIGLLATQTVQDNTPTFGNNRIVDQSVEVPSETVLMSKLKTLMQQLGIKTMSLEAWEKAYKKRTGENPSSNALADISNRIIAFANGEVTEDALTEEVMHFVVEALDQNEIQPLLDMIHKTDEWKQYSQQYFEIYNNEDTVRREVLGKVLKNRLQQSTLQGQSVLNRLQALLERFFKNIQNLFKPEHQVQLDQFAEDILKKIMAEELYSELKPEQFEGNTLVMYQANPKEPVYDYLTRVIEKFTRLDNMTGRDNSFSLSSMDIENLDEMHQLKAITGISNMIKLKVDYLNKRGRQEGFLSREEQAVYDTALNELLPTLTGLKNIVEEKVKNNLLLKQKVLEDVTSTITSLNNLSASLNQENETTFKELTDKVLEQTGLSDAMKEVFMNEMRTIQRDTNQFYALYGSLAQSNNAILSILGTVISDAKREEIIQFDRRQSEFINKAKALGFPEESIADALKTFKDGYYFLSEYDWDSFYLEQAKFKSEAYKEITGKDISPKDFLEQEEDLVKNLTQKDRNSFYFNSGEKIKKSGMLVDKLTKVERDEIDNLTQNFSELTRRFLNDIAKNKSNIMNRIRENGGASKEDNDELMSLTRTQQKYASPYNEDGKLLTSLSLNNEGEIEMDQDEFDNIKNPKLKERVLTVYELSTYNKARMKKYQEAEANGVKKASIPQSFINKMLKQLNAQEKAEFLKMNTRISYNNAFWSQFDKGNGVIEKLRATGEKEAIKTASEIEAKRNQLKNILKEFRLYNNPSQIDYEDMGRAELDNIKEISEILEVLYNKSKSFLKKEEREEKPSFSEAVVNEAYKAQIEDRGLSEITSEEVYRERLDFILKHVTSENRTRIIKGAENFIDYKKGTAKTLRKSVEKFHNNSQGTDFKKGSKEVYKDIIEYAESYMLPYFKELKPEGLNINDVIADLSQAKTEAEFNQIIENAEYLSITPSYALIDVEDNERLNPEYVKLLDAKKPMINLDYKDASGKRIFKNERFEERFGGGKNAKEKELLDLTMKFWEDSIESANMTKQFNKYQLPGIRRGDMARKHQLIKNFSVKNLKEQIKDITTVREDNAIYGQSIDNTNLQTVLKGSLVVPKIGFSKLDSADEVTDELLYSLMLTASEAEKRKQRVQALGKVEAIKTKLRAEAFGDKQGEATTAYKMADDFIRYNIYGQTETLTAEVNFLGKKVNVVPTIKNFQGWVRLVNLGFSVLTPLTSFLQGSANFISENVVGDRVNKEASKIAAKKAGRLVKDAVGEQFLSTLKAKGELNTLLQFFGLESPAERYKNSNYGRALRGLAISKSAFFTHFMGDVPLTAQTLLTVLHDFKIVDVTDDKGNVIDKKLQSYSEWRNENRAIRIVNNQAPLTESEAKSLWKTNENYLYNFIEQEKDSEGEIVGTKMSDEYYKIFNNKQDYAKDRLNFIKRKIQTVKQEIDNQVSSEDKSKIQRHAIYSFVALHKGFLITSITRRFKDRHLSLYSNQFEEGSYKGASNFLGAFIKGALKGNLKEIWEEQYKEFDGGYKMVTKNEGGVDTYYILNTNKKGEPAVITTTDKAYADLAYAELKIQMTNMRQTSLKRTLADIVVTTSLATIALLFTASADEDDDDYTKEFLAYMTYRLAVETTSQSTGLPGQAFSFLESPTTGLSQIQNILDIGDLSSGEIVKRGTYKGYSKRQAWLYKSLPGLKEYFKVKHIDRTRDSFMFYNKHYIENFNFASLMFDTESKK